VGEGAGDRGGIKPRLRPQSATSAARRGSAASARAGRAIRASNEDEVLSPDEELFVTAFVDYWLRRGALIVGGGE